MEASEIVAMVLGAAFVAGLALAVGACELFAVALARVILKRAGAR